MNSMSWVNIGKPLQYFVKLMDVVNLHTSTNEDVDNFISVQMAIEYCWVFYQLAEYIYSLWREYHQMLCQIPRKSFKFDVVNASI